MDDVPGVAFTVRQDVVDDHCLQKSFSVTFQGGEIICQMEGMLAEDDGSSSSNTSGESQVGECRPTIPPPTFKTHISSVFINCISMILTGPKAPIITEMMLADTSTRIRVL